MKEVSSSKNEIEKIIQDIKSRRDSWYFSPRRKNIVTLTELGLDQKEIFEIIIENLSWTDYVQGPEPDDHEPPIPGNIWIFGLNIENNEIYLKFQDRPTGIIVWISIHKAAYRLSYPYK